MVVGPEGSLIRTVGGPGEGPGEFDGPGGLLAYVETDEMDVPTVRVLRLVALEPEG